MSCSGLSCVITGFQRLSKEGIVDSSSGGGKSWTDRTTSLKNVRLDFDLQCVDILHWFTATFAGITSTSDGGQTWIQDPNPSLPNANYFALHCFSASDCLAVGRTDQTSSGSSADNHGVVIATHDVGRTWTTSLIAGPSTLLSIISCISAEACWVGGDTYIASAKTVPSGLVYGTTDGGITWTSETPPVNTGIISQLTCIQPSPCFALSENSAVPNSGSLSISLPDNGNHWSSLALPVYGFMPSAIECSDPFHCVLVGQLSRVNGLANPYGGPDAMIFVTSDAGSHWSSSTSL